ncbi:MAG: hypothetical protein H7256_02360 [Bdellovibrio sp.]|nr:hypothetical protein [Bdellovibrio sp.]
MKQKESDEEKRLSNCGELQNLTWGNDVSVNLTPALPQLQRQELIDMTWSEPLPRGEGFISAQSSLKAIDYKGALICDWKKMACELKFNLNKKLDVITFNWDSSLKKFVDTSGRASALDSQLEH